MSGAAFKTCTHKNVSGLLNLILLMTKRKAADIPLLNDRALQNNRQKNLSKECAAAYSDRLQIDIKLIC